jgi:hypothetical protein
MSMIHSNDVPIAVHDNAAGAPARLDLRDTGKLAGCVSQGVCGSCYAIVATQTLYDRLSLAGEPVTTLSHQLVTDCSNNCVMYRGNAKGCSEDCSGGFVTAALEFLVQHGTVSSGVYQSKHSGSGVHWDASQGEVRTICTMDAAAQNSKRFKADSHYGVTLDRDMGGPILLHTAPNDMSPKFLKDNAKNIAAEIALNGPVCATFNMFSDLPEYLAHSDQSEPYRVGWESTELDWGRFEGDPKWTSTNPGPDGKTHFVMAHAVSLVGYGTTHSGQKYWLVRNSWGPSSCSFKFARGINASSVEAMVEAPGIKQLDAHGAQRRPAAVMVKPPPSAEDIGGIVGGTLVGFVLVVIFVLFFIKR